MKIIKVNYIDGEVRFLVEGYEGKTFCIKLEKQISKEEVLEELKLMLPEKINPEDKYNDLDIAKLEGETWEN